MHRQSKLIRPSRDDNLTQSWQPPMKARFPPIHSIVLQWGPCKILFKLLNALLHPFTHPSPMYCTFVQCRPFSACNSEANSRPVLSFSSSAFPGENPKLLGWRSSSPSRPKKTWAAGVERSNTACLAAMSANTSDKQSRRLNEQVSGFSTSQRFAAAESPET